MLVLDFPLLPLTPPPSPLSFPLPCTVSPPPLLFVAPSTPFALTIIPTEAPSVAFSNPPPRANTAAVGPGPTPRVPQSRVTVTQPMRAHATVPNVRAGVFGTALDDRGEVGGGGARGEHLSRREYHSRYIKRILFTWRLMNQNLSPVY